MSQRAVRLLHITDTHLHASPASRMRGVATDETFRAVMRHALAGADRPDAILATGDLVQDETRAGYERFREVMVAAGVPVYCIPGNHDSPELMAELLNEPPFQCCGSVRHANWELVLLSTFSPGDDGGRLPPSELARLDETLAASDASHCLVCLHHHPVPMGSRWLDGVSLRNPDEFFEILDRHERVRGVLWGHVHQASDRRRHGLRLMSTPSTCLQFLPNSDDFAVDARPPGFRWLELRVNGTMNTEVVWLE